MIVLRDEFVDECKALLVEGEFTARWTLIVTYHKLGQMILEEAKDSPITEFTETVSVAVGRSERTLWHAVKFAKLYKKVDDLPEGKNIGWGKIVRKYLTDPGKPEEVCQHEPITICRICKVILPLDKPPKE